LDSSQLAGYGWIVSDSNRSSGIPAIMVSFWLLGGVRQFRAGFQQFWPDSSHFCLNPANLDSNKTVRVLAFISDFGNSSWNQMKVAEILPSNDRISSSVIFILFYINIYML
jgi:hypothetical protein